MIATPANADNFDAFDGFIASLKDNPGIPSSIFCTNASSDEGRLVIICAQLAPSAT